MPMKQQGEVRFSVRGKEYTAVLNIAAMMAIQDKFKGDPVQLIAVAVNEINFRDVIKYMQTICESNGMAKADIPDFTLMLTQGLVALSTSLIGETMGLMDGDDEPEKKPVTAATPKKPKTKTA